MATTVDVTPDGLLQLTVDGMTFPPLPVDAIETAYARIGDANNVAAKQAVTSAAHALTDVLAACPSTMTATLTVTSAAITAAVDPTTFAALEAGLGVTPDPVTGALVSGPLTVNPHT